MNGIGARIRKRRNELGITQQMLADRIGRSRNVIDKLEHERWDMRVQILLLYQKP